MDKEIFAIDKIEDNIVILENITSKEKKEINKEILPLDIKEGSIINYENNTYSLNINEEEKRRQQILERFKNLRKN